MRLPKFKYFEPETVKEAISLLHEYKGDARIMAGGTEMLPQMKQKIVTPRALVNIKRIAGLDQIDFVENKGFSIGALTTLNTINSFPGIKSRLNMLASSAGSVGTPQIRHMATLGGNVCLDSRCFYYNRSQTWRQMRSTCYHLGGNVCHTARGSDYCRALFVADTVPALIALGSEVTLENVDGAKQIALEDLYR